MSDRFYSRPVSEPFLALPPVIFRAYQLLTENERREILLEAGFETTNVRVVEQRKERPAPRLVLTGTAR